MRSTFMTVVGLVVAVVLQLVIAPNIAIMGSVPNFVLVYVAILAMLRQDDAVVLLGFFAGLVLDLFGTGAVGLMALLLTLAAFASSRVANFYGNETLVLSMGIAMVVSLLVEMVLAIYMAHVADLGLGHAMLVRGLPCALYDCAMCLIFYPLLSKVFAGSSQARRGGFTEMPTVKLR